MTLASTGPSGFHLKPLVTVFAAAVFGIAIFAVGLWVGNELWPDTTASVDAAASIENVAVAPDIMPSANWVAFAAGKFDDPPLPPSILTIAEPTTRSANWAAYDAGMLDPELAAANPSRYAASAAARTSANWAAYRAAKLDDAPFYRTVTVDVSLGNFAGLVSGRFDMEYAAENPGIVYVAVPEIPAGTSANWEAFEAGRLDDALSEP